MYDTEARIVSVVLCGEKFELLCSNRVTNDLLRMYGSVNAIEKKMKNEADGFETCLAVFTSLVNGARKFRYNRGEIETFEKLTLDDALDMPMDMVEVKKLGIAIKNAIGNSRGVNVKAKYKNKPKNMMTTK